MRLLATLMLCVTLLSCAVNRPAWYVSQGITLSECGPSVAAMVVRVTKGTNTTRFEARAFDRRGVNFLGWWSLNTVHAYLQSVGVPSQFDKVSGGAVRAGVYRIDKSHFVIAQQATDYLVRIAEPNPAVGVYSLQTDVFKSRVDAYYVRFYGSIL